MKKRCGPLFPLTGVAVLFLAACSVSPATTSEPLVEKTIYIGPQLVDCAGVAPQQCMQVKESPEAEYTLFYDQIEGFEYEAGYDYTLKVKEEKVENPPADAADFRWILVEIVSKTAASAPPAVASSLEGQTFSLDWYLSSAGEQVQVLPEAEITAEISEGTIGGSAGCNHYSASIQVDGDQVKIEQGMTTLMACAEPVMRQEQAYLETLGKAASYQLADGVLTFMDSQGSVILSFSTLQPLSLAGTAWQMTGYNNGPGGIASAIAGT